MTHAPPARRASAQVAITASPRRVGALYLDAWNRHDAAAVAALFAPGGVYIDTWLDRELSAGAIARHAARILAAVPDLVFDTLDESPSGHSTIATRWRMRGTSSGRLRALGPAGAEIELRGAELLRIDEGAIRSAHIYYERTLGPAPRARVERYQRSGLGPRASAALFRRVTELMRDERVFLDPDLTLAALAARLDASVHHLSQAINACAGHGLAELLAKARVEEAKRLLARGHEPMRAAMDAGFRSKSAFHAAFARHAGTTPRAFRERVAGAAESPRR